MMSDRVVFLSLAAAIGLFGGTAEAAQPRETPRYMESQQETEEARHARMTAHMQAWLRRLVGRFRIEYTGGIPKGFEFDRAQMADCVGIGTGAGVHCIFYVAQAPGEPQDEASGSARQRDNPAQPLHRSQVLRVERVIEFGFDPKALKIRLMDALDSPTYVNGARVQSVQRASGGVSSSNRLGYRVRCWHSPANPPCATSYWIEAPTDNGDIWFSVKIDGPTPTYRFVLRRIPPDQAGEGPASFVAPSLPAARPGARAPTPGGRPATPRGSGARR